MTREEFMNELRKKLVGLPKQEIEERLDFYHEIIDDRMEEGRTEEEAVADIGSVEEVAEQIIAEIPLSKIAKEKIKSPRRLRAWEIVLLALGSPIWLSLAIVLFAVILSVYVVLWSLVISVWSIFVSMIACAIAGTAAGVLFIIFNGVWSGLAVLGAAIVCGGVGIFLFFGCRMATNGVCLLTKKIALGIKKCFVKKEEVQ